MKRIITSILSLVIALAMCVSCNTGAPAESTPAGSTPEASTPAGSTPAESPEPSTPAETDPPAPASDTALNGVDISEYTIVFSMSQPDYNKTAANYIKDAIKTATGIELEVKTDSSEAFAHEIIVGETNRPLSSELNADTKPLEFAFLANETSVAMEADYFVIAAAAYYFVDTYITGDKFDITIPETVTLGAPIVEKPNNFIFLIGDGMGVHQTKMFEYAPTPSGVTTDGETAFYGYMLPYRGNAKTNSLSSGATDSAASGTALATGYKTINRYIGKDKNKNDVMSLTELANSLGKATAVMSTEKLTGATPAAFSAHVNDRGDSAGITASQKNLVGTILKTTGDSNNDKVNTSTIKKVLNELSKDEDGFFIMYEEAYIDKHCHNNDFDKAYKAMYRFNQAIGQFMEFAFYNPDTFLLITADHETGDLRPVNGELKYHSGDHSQANVYIFTYGIGAEIFNGVTIENVQIPKTIAKMWGKNDFGDTSSPYPAL